jgi:hypothetical protein
MRKAAARGFVALVAMALLVPILGFTPAGAAPPVPTLVSPTDGATVDANPVLHWNPVAGAAKYRVQVFDNVAMSGTPKFDQTTTNTYATPTTELASDPLGTDYWWRVSSLDSSNSASAYSSSLRFTKTPPAAPILVSPGDNAELQFPADPPTLTWNAVAGTKTYEIQIDTIDTFTSPDLTATTSSTSYTLTSPQVANTAFYWRVRAKSVANVNTQWSEVRSYTYKWTQTATLLSPTQSNNPVVSDVVFTWTSVPGAVQYHLQASVSADFNGTKAVDVTVKSTTYSPPTTLNNGSYYWRVEPVDTNNFKGTMSSVEQFTRAWPSPATPSATDHVTLLTPANGDTAVVQPDFSWTPQTQASRYEIWMGTDSNFSPSTYTTCKTNHTTFTPYNECGLNPAPGVLYYWRVRAIDDPLGINGVFSDTWSFLYRPNLVAPVSPANNATVSVPVLTWAHSVNDIGRYRVTVLKANGTTADSDTTYNTSYVPQGLKPEDGPFSWYIQTIDGQGREGVIPNPASYRRFTLTDPGTTYATPNANPAAAGSATRVPTLQWNPVDSNAKYRVMYAPLNSNIFTQMVNGLDRPAYAYPNSTINPGDYHWYVEATVGAVTTTGSLGTFSVTTMPSTTLTAPANCAAAPDPLTCPTVLDTPTMKWNPVPGATKYIVTLARDVNFTNVYETYTTSFHWLTPLESLADSQAGQATYWYARPCYNTACGAEPASFVSDPNSPVFSFRKQSLPVGGLVATGSSDQITFSWNDYLATNLANATPTTQEARSYVVEVSTTPEFTAIIDTSPALDQTTYTAFNKTYPDGNLYWRVKAIDGSSNSLPYGVGSPFVKTSPTPVPVSPSNNAVVSGAPTLSCNPLAFSKQYAVEFYKNVDQPLNTSNRVLNATVSVTAVSPTTPLAPGVYGWRIRRLDADNRVGPWTTDVNTGLRKYTVVGAAPTLVSPEDQSVVDGSNLVFRWNVAEGAAQYRIETANNAAFTNAASVTTAMTAYAPTSVLADGTYYWRVSSLDGSSNVLGTSAVWSFTAGSPSSTFHPLAPTRVLDSRLSPNPYPGGWNGKLAAGSPRDLTVNPTVPTTATAVVMNVTVTDVSTATFITAYPTGQSTPNASNLNVSANQTIANLVTVKLGYNSSGNGQVRFANQNGTVNLIADVVGYYSPGDDGDGFTSLAPNRVLDSRTSTGGWNHKLGPGDPSITDLTVTGNGVPSTADAVVMNVTMTDLAVPTFLTVFPNGSTIPTASNINGAAGDTLPNLVTVKVGTGGKVRFRNQNGSINVIADVVGYYEHGTGDAFHALSPIRALDSRGSTGGWNGKLLSGSGNTRSLQVSSSPPNGVATVTPNASAVIMNVTATDAVTGTFITVYPSGSPPNSSNLNVSAGQTIPNLVITKLASGGSVRFYNAQGSVNVIADVVGFFAPD